MTTTPAQRDPLTLGVSVLLVVVAFAGSFTHVRETVQAHGQTGWLAWAIAGMPELTVALAMRKIMMGDRGTAVWITGGSAGLFTLAANLAGAEHSAWGFVAAGWPAWSAVGAMLLAGVHAPPVATQTATEVTFRRATRTPPAVAAPVATRPAVASRGHGQVAITAAVVATDWDGARKAWEESGRTLRDAEIAALVGASKDAARSRRRGWDGTRR